MDMKTAMGPWPHPAPMVRALGAGWMDANQVQPWEDTDLACAMWFTARPTSARCWFAASTYPVRRAGGMTVCRSVSVA